MNVVKTNDALIGFYFVLCDVKPCQIDVAYVKVVKVMTLLG